MPSEETVELSPTKDPSALVKARKGLNLAERSARTEGSVNYQFGIGKKELAEQLRLLADAVENEQVAVQNVFHVTRAKDDDFLIHWVNIEFAAKGRGD